MPAAANSATRSRCSSSGSEQEDLADETFGRELDGALAVAGVPRLDHGLDLVAAAEPAEELRVDGHGGVCDERALGGPSASSSGPWIENSRQASSLSGLSNVRTTCSTLPSGRKFANMPSAFSAASRSIRSRSAASTIGTGSAGGD